MTERNIKEMFKMMDTCISAVDNLRTDMNLGFSKLNAELSEVKRDVTNLRSDVSQLKTDVTQLKTDFVLVNKRLDEFGEKQDRFEVELRRNNRALDRVADHWIRTDIQIGRLGDAII